MPLSGGEKLGPYEISAPLGAGGMGEVYRARDTRLKRDVAVKVLPQTFAFDPERMARFQREAEVLASLNHPNIAHIYGVEDRALIMELVEGESPKGPLPFDEAWKIASQMAEALEYAHEKGVVHRDLKPANLKVTPDGVVKLLDFGLAKAFNDTPESPNTDPVNSPTLTINPTVTGVILGTAAYMAPEQARGKRVDKRADVWSWGVVLYELLTGERLFQGDDAADTLAQVLTKEPDLTRVPPQLRKLLERCLEKDPRKRLRDIGDARHLLREKAEFAAPLPARKARWFWPAVAALLLPTSGALAWIAWRPARPVEHPPIRLNVNLGPDAVAGAEATLAISPDGTRIVFPVQRNGTVQLATRLLDQADATPIRGSEGGTDPFFSPDGQWIAFFSGRQLMKAPVQGTGAVPLCYGRRILGGYWSENGNIIFGGPSGLRSCSAATAALQQVSASGYQVFPQLLPGGSAIIFTAAGRGLNTNIDVLSLKTGRTRTLISDAYAPLFVPTGGEKGHLLYLRLNRMFRVAFDPDKLDIQGSPTPLVDDVSAALGGFPANSRQYDVSRNGTLVYLIRKAEASSYPISLLDANGKTTELVAQGIYDSPRFSPDGKRLAYLATVGQGADVWTYDVERKNPAQLTFNAPGNNELAWAPDSKHLVFSSGSTLWWARADGSEPPQTLLDIKGEILRPQSFAPDGRRLAFVQGNLPEIWTIPLDLTDPEHPKPGKPEPFLNDPKIVEIDAAFSPDGRFLAYDTDESGNQDVYVRPFPGPGGKWKVSTAGGKFPVWSRSAHQLFFLGDDDRIMMADFAAQGDTFSPGVPRPWSSTRIRRNGVRQVYDLAPDGKHIAMFPAPAEGPPQVTFIFNFFDYIQRLSAPGK
jgi:Tol biopolymer transport system component